MVLPAYQSLKDGGSSSTVSATTNPMRRSNASSVTASNLNLSSLTLSDSNQVGSHSHLSSYNSVNSSSQGATLKRGWGSTETRSASTSLSTMAGASDDHFNGRLARPVAVENQPGDKDGWGYFVDVAEDDDEDVLMW